jgi:HD-GYP domain-containing protein (c-di-GMP phosphodiesterase class II)
MLRPAGQSTSIIFVATRMALPFSDRSDSFGCSEKRRRYERFPVTAMRASLSIVLCKLPFFARESPRTCGVVSGFTESIRSSRSFQRIIQRGCFGNFFSSEEPFMSTLISSDSSTLVLGSEYRGVTEPSERSLELQSQLSQSFDSPMQIWCRRDDGWHIVGQRSHENTNLSLSESTMHPAKMGAWFDQLVASAATQTQSCKLSDHQVFVAVISWNDDGTPEVIGGVVERNLEQLVERTAELTILKAEAAGRQTLLDDYAHRLSSGYEEMAFLRQLSQHIKICVATRTLAEATTAILPQLRELIAVESIVLISPQLIIEGPSSNSQSNGNSPQLGNLECYYGEMSLSQNILFELIQGLPQFENRTIVRNYATELGGSKNGPNLRSIVITPIRSDNVLYGWLVGINKLANSSEVRSTPDSLGGDELGSMEATLLESAASMLSSHASNNRLYQEMEIFMIQAIQTLVGVVEAKDLYTYGHSERVASIARCLAHEMGLSSQDCQDIYLAGLLHDIGKVGVPDDVLLKPGKLNDAEFAKIKLHPEIGAKLIQGLKPLVKLVPGVLHHHEAFDGSGYPHRLAGESIPLMARILAVADAFDAMTSCRPYRVGMSREVAEDIIRSGIDKQWDGRVVEAFLSCRSEIAKIISRSAQTTLLNH